MNYTLTAGFILHYVVIAMIPAMMVAVLFGITTQKHGKTNIDNSIDLPFWWSFFGGVLGLLSGLVGVWPALLLYDKVVDPTFIGDDFYNFRPAFMGAVIVVAAATLGSILGGIYGLKRFRRSRRR